MKDMGPNSYWALFHQVLHPEIPIVFPSDTPKTIKGTRIMYVSIDEHVGPAGGTISVVPINKKENIK